jgi:amidase
MTDQTRRDLLMGSAAIGGTITVNASTRTASAQRTESTPKSEWDYRTLKELVDALQARKVSASELTERNTCQQ